MEVCIDSVESALNAEMAGAKRVELCSNLLEGGTTPSVGMLRIIKQHSRIPVYVMIRPRGGDFLYSDFEFDVMKSDVEAFKEAGADGVVLGILTEFGEIDCERCQELIAAARPLPVTFHRAIDMTKDIYSALERVIALGCKRVLTSGGENTALEGAPCIAKMVEQADGRITVMPGGGITERNLRRILEMTGCKEFHGSARISLPSGMEYQNKSIAMGATLSPPEFTLKVTSTDRIKELLSIARKQIN